MEATLPGLDPIDGIALDFNRLGFATTNDFLRMTRARPGALEVLGPVACSPRRDPQSSRISR